MTDRKIGQRSVALVGFMASGKTTIGRRLALSLALPFIDTDAEIALAFGLSVDEIFLRYGEETFRDAERHTVERLVGGGARVLSLGGGAYADAATRTLLKAQATTVWLDPPFEFILERLGRSPKRPLAFAKSPDELRDLWKARRKNYAESHVHIVPSDADLDRTVAQILAALA